MLRRKCILKVLSTKTVVSAITIHRKSGVLRLCGSEEFPDIREVIAFPKNNKALDLMIDSPTNADIKQTARTLHPEHLQAEGEGR